ncbi:hypothetical protein ABQE10_19085, partial [Enterococcus avium]
MEQLLTNCRILLTNKIISTAKKRKTLERSLRSQILGSIISSVGDAFCCQYFFFFLINANR